MSLRRFMDSHVHGAITTALRQRGLDVLTAQEDGSDALPDPDLLDRSTALDRVLVMYDRDFLVHCHDWQVLGKEFAGVIRVSVIGSAVADVLDDVQLIVESISPQDMRNSLMYVPL